MGWDGIGIVSAKVFVCFWRVWIVSIGVVVSVEVFDSVEVHAKGLRR